MVDIWLLSMSLMAKVTLDQEASTLKLVDKKGLDSCFAYLF